ncbi:MAG: non-heme iron oxygenase ferredoxin subunit [Actinobacteria bacterium]|nr:non-heme iron oxygenase ferredoxin subunit [Actinomycetota bacterium]
MRDFKEVAHLDEVPDGATKQVAVDGELIGLFRDGDDVYAIGDVCTHQEAYLTEGEWEPDELEVECPLHGSRFDVETGSVRILPATKPARSYQVRVEGNSISVGPRK